MNAQDVAERLKSGPITAERVRKLKVLLRDNSIALVDVAALLSDDQRDELERLDPRVQLRFPQRRNT